MFKGIEHLTIAAKDTEGLAYWYCRTFGFEVAYKNQKTPPTLFVKLGGASLIEIIPANDREPHAHELTDAGLRHLAVATDDFDGDYVRLKQQGVNFTDEPKEASGGVRVVYLSDPEGTPIHLIYRPNPL